MFRSALTLATLIGLAHAQEPTPDVSVVGQAQSGRESFAPDFFKAYSPQNALDMVSRVPSFSIDGGSDRRGFGGTAGNVLIDGVRPSAKNQNIRDILSRVPADQVLRIDLIRGATSSEAGGQSVLVDVIRTPGGGSGTYVGALERSESNRVTPRGEVSYSGRQGKTEYTIGLERYLEERPLEGTRALTGPTGAPSGSRLDFTPRTFRQASGTGSFSTPILAGVLRGNTQAERWNFRTTLDSLGFDAAGAPTESFRLSINERQRSKEIGGDFERDLGAWGVKLIALDTQRLYANDESTISSNAAGAQTEVVRQRTRNDSRESILRATASRDFGKRGKLEFGAEGALNALETNLNLTIDTGAGPIVVDLEGANVTVEEERAEAFISYSFKPAPAWSFESTLTVENSSLSQSGDSAKVTELTYWKPSVQLTRRFGEKDEARVRVYRHVSQLDFGDFASSVALADERVAGGNPDLRPQATWYVQSVLDHRWGQKGAVALTLYAARAEDVIDNVPVSGFDAPGNIGEGDGYGVNIKSTVPVGFLIPGGEFEFVLDWERARVSDPVTGLERDLNGHVEREVEVSFRQDLPKLKFAWGAELYKGSQVVTYRVAELDTFEEGPFISAFVETRAVKGLKIRLFGHNLDNTNFVRERIFFTGDRNGPQRRTEVRDRQFGRFVGVRVSGTF